MSDKKNETSQELKEDITVAEVISTEVKSVEPENVVNEAPRAPQVAGRGQGQGQGGAGGGRRRGGGRGGQDSKGGGSRDKRRGGRRDEKPEKEFEEELLQIDRVTRVVKGGRRLRFRATVAIGDRRGRVGFGVDKAIEVPQAIQKAVRNARKNMIEVPIVNGTIAHEVKVKYKSAKILIMPAKNGTGIIAGGAMRKIADLAGIEDMLGKNIGTNNRITSGKAMMLALASLQGAKPSDLKQKPTELTPEKSDTPKIAEENSSQLTEA